MRPVSLSVCAVVMSAMMLSVPSGWAAVPKPVKTAQPGVYKLEIDKSVSFNDAAESMRLRANALNLQLVAELPLSKQVEAIVGKPQRIITIFQFCDAVIAKELIDMSIDFATYMPCRIAMIEDVDGRGWLIMTDINVDMLAKEKKLQKVLTKRIKGVRDGLIEIMQAGAKGAL